MWSGNEGRESYPLQTGEEQERGCPVGVLDATLPLPYEETDLSG